MNTSWASRAACHGLDPRLFFPAEDDDPEVAKAVCAQCAVREPCLEFALGAREREGVWGGCTEAERRRIARRRRRAS
ncbi:MAG TPA: WhiB family transcriptional regulator [Acidimicrobiales bacterium]|nr:WhiB family transcriptional regulator [Acidimicrobiales bacterium]